MIVSQSCTKGITEESIDDNFTNPIVPLKIGNTWSYNISDFDKSGAITTTHNIVYQVYRDTMINNEKWYCWNNVPYTNDWWTNRNDGLWHLEINKGNNSYSISQVYKYPIIKGNVYNKTEVISLHEMVAVPAGIFDCVHIRVTLSDLRWVFEEYLSPNIGQIKWSQNGINPDGSLYLIYWSELNNYVLK